MVILSGSYAESLFTKKKRQETTFLIAKLIRKKSLKSRRLTLTSQRSSKVEIAVELHWAADASTE